MDYGYCPTFPKNSWYFDGFFRNNQGIFGVHYGDPAFMLHMPTPMEAPGPETPKFGPQDFYRPTWIHPFHPYLLLLPRSNPFRGQILSCLDIDPRSVPIVSYEVMRKDSAVPLLRWGMPQSLVDSWLRLEGMLNFTLAKMVGLYGGHVAEGVYPFNSPVTQDYHLRWASTREIAVKVAIRSRDAFLPLMAMMTMMFILLDAKKAIGDWRAKLLRENKLPWQWLDDLEASTIGDMRTERMGGIFDLTLSKDHSEHHLPRHMRWFLQYILKSHRVPLYFFYRDGYSKEPIPPALKDLGLVPDVLEVDYLMSLPGDVAFSPWSTRGRVWKSLRNMNQDELYALQSEPMPAHEAFTPSPCPDSSQQPNHFGQVFPPVEAGSGQHQGETIHEFLARRKQKNEKLLKEESPAAKQRRLAREQVAATGEPPSLHGKHHTRVYIWEPPGLEVSLPVRRFYGRQRAYDRWDEFGPTQRIYDGFSNEWDLCAELDENGSPDVDDFDGYDDDDDDFGVPLLGLLPPLPATPGTEIITNASAETAVQILEEVHNEGDEKYEHRGYHELENAEINAHRYGFQSSSTIPQNAPAVAAVSAAWACGDLSWKNQLPHGLCTLFQAIIDAGNPQTIPHALCDLNVSAADLHTKNWPVLVKQVTLKSRRLYFFVPDDNADPYVLVEDAATAILCIRAGWPDTRSIIRGLTRIGAVFFPCWHRPLARAPQHPPLQTTLGRRSASYAPTAVDYAAYVERRDGFLRSSRGCVALFHGGIVARIARMVLDDYEDKVCVMPSEEDLDFGVQLAGLQLPDGGSLWYEALTPSEIDLVCGVYGVETGQADSTDSEGAQLRYASYWPQPPAFYASGLNTGWWNANNERNFQKRMQELANNGAKLHTNQEWKSVIRFNKMTPKIFSKNSALSSQFLESCPAVGHF